MDQLGILAAKILKTLKYYFKYLKMYSLLPILGFKCPAINVQSANTVREKHRNYLSPVATYTVVFKF